MIILDTSIWIGFFKKEPIIFEPVKKMLEEREVLAVECIFGELLQGSKNDRERDIIITYWKYLPKVNEKEIWIEAGKYSGERKLPSKGVGLIDSVILVSAIRTNAKIWTLDKKLKGVLGEELAHAPALE